MGNVQQGIVKKAKFYQITWQLVIVGSSERLIISMLPLIRSTLHALVVAAVMLGGPGTQALAAECYATSGAQRVAVLELYTSEGCDSCPPADAWIRELPAKKLTPARVIPLAFHVDYWDYIGWRDPYSQAYFGERQRQHGRRRGASFVFTPQLLLNGQNYRRAPFFDDIESRIKTINQMKPQADIRLRLSHTGASLDSRIEVSVDGEPYQRRAQIYIAIYENNLVTAVTAGENKGRTLRHDFVVRELVGPLTLNEGSNRRHIHSFQINSRWKPQDIYLAVFVQNSDSGDILQALSASCP